MLDAFTKAMIGIISVEAMVVFGSRATGDNLEDSDYDILVLSPDFERYNRFERIQVLLDRWPGSVALEPVALTPAEFREAEGALIWDILHDGLAIHDNGTFEKKRASLHERMNSGELARDTNSWAFS
jgi:predicted nucleotidyltransferase